MRTIHLLRHAKSDEPSASREDFDRPLSDPGRYEALLIGEHLAALDVSPTLLLCSAAKRALETSEIIGKRLSGLAPRIEVRQDLYLASQEALLAAIRAVPDGVSSLMLIGHNPGLHGLAVLLIGSGRDDAMKRLRRKYPTGGLARIVFEAARWVDIAPRGGSLEDYVIPKDLA